MRSTASAPAPRTWTAWIEWSTAVLLTAAAVFLQVVNLRHAGGMWRDEVAAVNLAQMPSWSAIWSHLEHESFPLLITLVMRLWSAAGFGGTDAGLRTLGLLISVGLLGAIWWSTWRLARRPPMFSLLLIALSPVALRWGGSMRAYGLGVFLALLAITTVWRLSERPSWKTFVAAAAVSVLAVHALYQNALVLLAVCVSAIAIASTRREWRAVGLIASVGGLAAASLLPYIGVIRRASDWNVATEVPIDLARIWTVLHRALTASGSWMLWLWAALLLMALVLVIVRTMCRNATGDAWNTRLAGFLAVSLAITALAYFVFIKATKFPTEEWYYLLPVAVFALAIDVLIARGLPSGIAAAVRPLTAVVAAAFVVPVSLLAVQIRATNLDIVARELNEQTRAGDLILVHPWFCGVTVARYYTGPAEVLTVPPLGDIKLQRLDLVKEQMRNERTLDPLLQRTEATLRSGRTVWLVGHFPFSDPPRPAPTMPPAGEGPEGWRAAPYMTAYGMGVAYFIQMHALQSSRVELDNQQAIHPFENLPLRAISGWRQPRSRW